MVTDKINQDFLGIKLTTQTLGFYAPRKLIANAFHEVLPKLFGKTLDVGCGVMPYMEFILSNKRVTEYIGMDLDNYQYYQNKPQIIWDGITIPLEDNAVDSIVLTEVLEHCPYPSATLKEINRVLKKDGVLFLTVPFLWFLHEVPYDEYRYTPFSLKRHLEQALFREIDLRALGGWNASLAQILGLWIAYKPMNKRVRTLLRIFVFPLYWLLFKTDKRPDEFTNASMITGLYCTCKK